MLKTILSYFDAVNAFPRCSKNEAMISRWLAQWGSERGYRILRDAVGNMVLRVPASPGLERAPTVIIQGHMDMVCEKTSGSMHDFSRDPIVARHDGEWLSAQDTSLGADNGIALAYALALADDAALVHPSLDLLFTVDEESGLRGVKQMGEGLISGSYLINLDSEEEGVFTIGCAGGRETELHMSLDSEWIPEDWQYLELGLGGLRGGHSGIDIHKQRGNANKLMARALSRIRQSGPIRLVRFLGGSRHNAIAREAVAFIAVPPHQAAFCNQEIASMNEAVMLELAESDPDVMLTISPGKTRPAKAPTLDETDRIIQLLLTLPHGVSRMSPVDDGIVETSCNLAVVRMVNETLNVVTSQRSLTMAHLEDVTAGVHAAAAFAGAAVAKENQYPPWTPDPDAQLVQTATCVYRHLFSISPKIQVIHAGLECAIIGDRHPGLQMISFGPTIENAHSPMERLHIPAVEKVWHLLTALIPRVIR